MFTAFQYPCFSLPKFSFDALLYLAVALVSLPPQNRSRQINVCGDAWHTISAHRSDRSRLMYSIHITQTPLIVNSSIITNLFESARERNKQKTFNKHGNNNKYYRTHKMDEKKVESKADAMIYLSQIHNLHVLAVCIVHTCEFNYEPSWATNDIAMELARMR